MQRCSLILSKLLRFYEIVKHAADIKRVPLSSSGPRLSSFLWLYVHFYSDKVALPPKRRHGTSIIITRHKRVGITVSSDYGWPSNLKLAARFRDHLAGNKQFREEPWTTAAAGRWPACVGRHAGFDEELFRGMALSLSFSFPLSLLLPPSARSAELPSGPPTIHGTYSSVPRLRCLRTTFQRIAAPPVIQHVPERSPFRARTKAS